MELNDITYAINGAIFEVNRVLGPGFLEKVYENALIVELKERGLSVTRQVPIKVDYKGSAVGEYIADILVENQVIIEIKTVDKLNAIHKAADSRRLTQTFLEEDISQENKSSLREFLINYP